MSTLTRRPAIVPLDDVASGDEARTGGKAYNCARLKQAGFLVPDGLVVLSSATYADLAALDDHEWFDGLADARFAVRSSGIGEDGEGQSFAGIHQTLLDVSRADVRRAVVECRASARSPQALEYRRAKGISTADIEMGVLVQRMIQPVASGVAFTVNPVSGAADELVINASWGVGEALVSGQVEPDEFVVHKRDGELLWSHTVVGSLSPVQVRALAGLLVRIETHYGAPQDVEWCHDRRDFWIVQSRPITTHAVRADETEWTRANLAEVLPDVTSPQALAALAVLLNHAERQYMGKLLAPDERLGPMVKSFCGRLYFNLSQMRHVCAVSNVAPAEMLRSVGHAEAIHADDERPAPLAMSERLAALPSILGMVWLHLRAAQIVRTHEQKTEAFLHRLSAHDPGALPDTELWSGIAAWLGEVSHSMQAVLLLSGVMIHETPVRKVCEKVGFPYERLVYPQLAAGERSISAQQAWDLLALAETARRDPAVVTLLTGEMPDLPALREQLRGTAFLGEFERFLQSYGHRGRYESDWSLPRYSEDPSSLLHALRAHLGDDAPRDLAETARRQEREAADAWAAFEARLTPWQRRVTLPRVRRSIGRIKQYYVWREQVRSDIVRVAAQIRRRHLTLADRFVERGWIDTRDDYFLLHLEEVGAAIDGSRGPDSLRTIADDRRAEQARHRSMQMPLLMRESELPRLIRTAGVSSRTGDERQLTGHPVSGGCVEAEVVVVRDPGDFAQMKRGAILVAPATDPSWTPLFTLASGVIVEVGGVLSHASTIAREYGLPAVANVKHATRRLKTGERVRLDAVQGLITRTPSAVPPGSSARP